MTENEQIVTYVQLIDNTNNVKISILCIALCEKIALR